MQSNKTKIKFKLAQFDRKCNQTKLKLNPNQPNPDIKYNQTKPKLNLGQSNAIAIKIKLNLKPNII